MYYIDGIKKTIETQFILSQALQNKQSEPAKFRSWTELKHSMNRYLKTIQPEITIREVDEPIISVDKTRNRQLVRVFNNDSKLNDLKQQQVISTKIQDIPKWQIEIVQNALSEIKRIDPVLSELISNTINYIFFSDSTAAGGGSTSAAIGCIWVNPRQNWTLQDTCELLVHELTHNLLFLDERRYGHYSDYQQLNDPKYFAHSSILKRPRPLDKVVHSFVVASEVLTFRKKHFGSASIVYVHPNTGELITNLNKTYASLKGLPQDIIKKRAWEIIDHAHNAHRCKQS